MRGRLFVIVLVTGLASCTYFTNKRQAGIIAEVDGQYLYERELSAVTIGLHGADSAAKADEYIRAWATPLLVAEQGKKLNDPEINDLLRDYQQSLYRYAYERKVVQQRMPKNIEDSVVEAFYNAHADQFILKETIAKGILLVIPNKAPDIAKVSKLLQNMQEEDIEWIEKYAYQYASGYEYFVDEWRTANQLLVILPFTKNDLIHQLQKKKQIEMHDTISTYIMQVTDKHIQGERMPLEYARPEIEAILLSERQVTFLEEERRKLFETWQTLRKLKIER